jgi:hypothetical protein
MGTLAHHPVQEYIDQYGLRVFVETGTGRGDGLAHARRFPFERLYSVEIVESQAEEMRLAFAGDARVTIAAGSSVSFLRRLLPTITVPTLFWLDAHYPGADLGLAAFDAEPDRTVRLPLPEELRVIHEHRPAGSDVILIDDRRIYEAIPQGEATPVAPALTRHESIEFVDALFGTTHRIVRGEDDTGWLALLPAAACKAAACPGIGAKGGVDRAA